MELLRTVVKDILIPGSGQFLILGMSIGVPLLFCPARAARWGRWWLTVLLLLYLVLSLQGTSDFLVWGLTRGYPRIRNTVDAQHAGVVVVLGNGIYTRGANGQEITTLNLQSAHNVLEAARLFRLLEEPLVVVSGGLSNPDTALTESQVLAAALEQLGVPSTKLILEGASQTTNSQGHYVSQALKARNDSRFVLVTAPEHMRRAVGVFASQGLHPIPSISALWYGGPQPWLPSRFALEGSRNALYEYLALGFYWWRGWI